MRIRVKAQPRSSLQRVVQDKGGPLKVYLKSSPTDGKANKELCRAIAEFYKVKKSAVKIITGHTSRNKIVEIKE